MSEHLYTTLELGRIVGMTSQWVRNRVNTDPRAPRPDYTANGRGSTEIMLWTESSLERWRRLAIGMNGVDVRTGHSDHLTVNQVGALKVTWALWWRCVYDGRVMWWFSTPIGWWTSEDDGRTWQNSGRVTRPTDYRYLRVNGNVNVNNKPATMDVIQSAKQLRTKIEKWSDIWQE